MKLSGELIMFVFTVGSFFVCLCVNRRKKHMLHLNNGEEVRWPTI